MPLGGRWERSLDGSKTNGTLDVASMTLGVSWRARGVECALVKERRLDFVRVVAAIG